MDELKQIRVSVIIHSVIAILMGYASVVVTNISRSLVAGIVGILVLLVVGFATQRLVNNKDRKWWLSNGVVPYLLVWLISWTVFHNLGV